jgi:hypothetical protein
VHAGPAAIRAAVYTWLEEISFAAGVTVLLGLVAITGGVIAVSLLTAAGRPPSAARSVADPAAVTVPRKPAPPPVGSGPPVKAARPARAATVNLDLQGNGLPGRWPWPTPPGRPAAWPSHVNGWPSGWQRSEQRNSWPRGGWHYPGGR